MFRDSDDAPLFVQVYSLRGVDDVRCPVEGLVDDRDARADAADMD